MALLSIRTRRSAVGRADLLYALAAQPANKAQTSTGLTPPNINAIAQAEQLGYHYTATASTPTKPVASQTSVSAPPTGPQAPSIINTPVSAPSPGPQMPSNLYPPMSLPPSRQQSPSTIYTPVSLPPLRQQTSSAIDSPVIALHPRPQTSGTIDTPVTVSPLREQTPSTHHIESLASPYRLVAIEDCPVEPSINTIAEPSTGALTANDSAAWDASYAIPAATSIVPWTRLWPRLRLAVAQPRRAGLNVPRLIQQIARGVALQQLPRINRQAWPQPLTVIFDFSDRLTVYWDDWHALNRQLEQQLHQQVRCYRLRGIPQKPLEILAQGQPSGEWCAAPPLAAHSTVLIASDLGMADAARPWPRACWQQQLADYRRRGVRVVVLAPVSVHAVTAELANAASVIRLSPDSALRPLPRLRPNPANRPAHPGCHNLLALLSIATRVETALLRQLRRCLPGYSHDAGLEAEVWCHPHVDTAPLACALSPYALSQSRDDFQKLDAEVQQRAFALLRAWHSALPQAIHHEETLVWHYLAHQSAVGQAQLDAARRFFQRLTHSLQDPHYAAQYPAAHQLQIQLADRHLHWLPTQLASQEAYVHNLQAAVRQADPQRAAVGLPTAVNPVERLAHAAQLPPQTLTLVQHADLSLSLLKQYQPDAATKGCTPLAQISLHQEVVLLALQNPVQYQPWYWQSSALLANDWRSDGSANLYLRTDEQQWLFQPISKPPWATAFGQDQYGMYADVVIKGISQRFRWINPGRFLMGSPEFEFGRSNDELQHRVTLSKGYWLADTACTQALWLGMMGNNPAWFNKDFNYPVEQVSWYEVQRFIECVNDFLPDLNACLPTEAQWEYACRAGTTTKFAFGDNINAQQVNYDDWSSYEELALGKYWAAVVAVKTLPANPWGLYESHGNVWEWCQDWYGAYPTDAVIDPQGASTGVARVLRGGSWLSRAKDACCANRGRSTPEFRNRNIGFRLALG